ncbi:MAG: TlpA family protein disulfide reductase [Methylomicrobium sp.]
MNRKSTAMLWGVLVLAPLQSAFAANVGDSLPQCALSSIDGARPIDLSEYKGKVLYLDFWASWCGPCAKSFPFMNQLQEEFSGKGLTLIGVNLDENPEDANAFLAQHPANFTIAADKGEQCARQFDVKAMPSSYLIGLDGVIRHVHLGFREDAGKELREAVEKLLAEKSPAANVK